MRGLAKPGSSPTKRELEVAAELLKADSVAAAAARLGIGTRTANDHLANLQARLGARHREELFFRLRDHLAA